MSEMVEMVAKTMYWNHANPDMGHIVLDIAVPRWRDLPDMAKTGAIWMCKSFWREASVAAITAMRSPTDAMVNVGLDAEHEDLPARMIWEFMIDEALKD